MELETPFGPAWARFNDAGAITGFGFGVSSDSDHNHCHSELARQLKEYFAGQRRSFDLALAPAGSAFQQHVWAELIKIPFGKVITYAELAARVGRPGAARATGRANATNRIALIVPCHRVIGSSGALTGYAYGMSLKQELLAWERSVSNATL